MGLLILYSAGLATAQPLTNNLGLQNFEREALFLQVQADPGTAELTHVVRIEFPYLGETVLVAKILDRHTGSSQTVVLDPSLRPVDIARLRQDELAAYDAVNGKKHHVLTEHLAKLNSNVAVNVAIWMEDPKMSSAETLVQSRGFELRNRKAFGGDVRAARSALIAEKQTIYVAYNNPLAETVGSLGGQVDYVSELAPLIFATLTADQIAKVASLEEVQRIYSLPLLQEQLATANPAVQNTAMKAAEHTGNSGIKVAILERGRVDFSNIYLDHLAGDTFRPDGVVSEHATNVAGCVAAKRETMDPPDQAYPTKAADGMAPDINLLSANTYSLAVVEPSIGGDGIANTAPSGDDVEVISVGDSVVIGATIVSAGVNGVLDTDPVGDDIIGVDNSRLTFLKIAAPVEWAISNGADIINISLGEDRDGDTSFSVFDRYVDHIVFEHSVAVVKSAGNECGTTIFEQKFGGNSIADTLAVGDDIQEVPVRTGLPPEGTVISAGPNGILDTFPTQSIREPDINGNGISDSVARGDDVQVIPKADSAPPDAIVVGPGINGLIDSHPAGDDFIVGDDLGRCEVTSPGLAYNAITVGAIDDNDTAMLADDDRAPYSSWRDLEGDHEKPEISAPGSSIFTTSTTKDSDGDGINDEGVDGTSFAAPIVSGYLANMVDMDPTLSVWPEATKAIAIASAKRNVYSHGIERIGDSVHWDPQEGAGTIWIDEGYEIINNGHYDKNIVVAGDFPRERIVGVKAGARFRYAIAWPSHTSGVTRDNIHNDVLESDLDLHVYDMGGNLVTWSDTMDNGYEVVAFDSPKAENYRVVIVASRFDAASESLGEAWNADDEFVTWIFGGIADGGMIEFVIEGVTIQITTVLGQASPAVVSDLVAAINSEPVLSGLGISASAFGSELVISGDVTGITITDPGIDLPLNNLLSPLSWDNHTPFPSSGDTESNLQLIRITDFNAQGAPNANIDVEVAFKGHIDLSIPALAGFGLIIGELDEPVGDPAATIDNGFRLRFDYGDFPQRLTLSSTRTDHLLALLKLPDVLHAEGTSDAANIEIKTDGGPLLADTSGSLLLPGLTLGRTEIGSSGIVISATGVAVDLHPTESPAAINDGDGSFQGVVLDQVTVDLPPDFGGVTVAATDFVIGPDGVTGRIDANLSEVDFEIGGVAASLSRICVDIIDNEPELCGIEGALELPAEYFACLDSNQTLPADLTYTPPDTVHPNGFFSAVVDLDQVPAPCKKIRFGDIDGSFLELDGPTTTTYDCQLGQPDTNQTTPASFLRFEVTTDPFLIRVQGSTDKEGLSLAPIGVLHLDEDLLKPTTEARGIVLPSSFEIGADGACLGCGSPPPPPGTDPFTLSLPPLEIGSTGVEVCADDIAIDLDESRNFWSASSPLNNTVDASGEWTGFAASALHVRVPFKRMDSGEKTAFEAADLAIGSGGVTGAFAASGVLPMVDFGGFEVDLQALSLDFVHNTPTAAGAEGLLLTPFIDEKLGLGFSLDGQGDWLASIDSPDGSPINADKKLGAFELRMALKRIAFGRQDAKRFIEVDADVAVKTTAFDTGEISLDKLRILPLGDIDIDGGWFTFDTPKVISLGPFPYELSRLSFGNRLNGRRWISLGGFFQLQDVLPIDLDLHDVTMSWDPGTLREPKFDWPRLEIPAIGVSMEIPDVLTLDGTLRWCEVGQPGCDTTGLASGRWFEAEVDVSLVSPPMSIDGQLLVGKADNGGGEFTFWFTEIQADLPAGIPIPGTGASIFGFSGGFGKNVRVEVVNNTLSPPSPQRGSFVFTAGAGFGTTPDNGFALNSEVKLVVQIPGPLIALQGKAWILIDRLRREDPPLATIDIIYDGEAREFLIAMVARYQGKTNKGDIIDARGNFEVFLGPEDWHLFLGTRSNPITAQVFKDFVNLGAEAYLMFGTDVPFPSGPKEGFVIGAAIRVDARGPVKKSPVGYEFVAAAGGELSLQMQPKQVLVMVYLQGRVAVFVGPIHLGLGLEAWLKGQISTPFEVAAGVRVEINLPWPLKDVGFDVEVSWSKGASPPVPPQPIDRVVFASAATGHTEIVECNDPNPVTIPLDSVANVTFSRRVDCRSASSVRPCTNEAQAQAASADFFRDTVGNCRFSTHFTDWTVSGQGAAPDLSVKGGWGGQLGEVETGPAADRRYQTFSFKPFRYAFEECPGGVSNQDQPDLCRPVTMASSRVCRVLPALEACGGVCGGETRTLRHTVGDRDELHPGDPEDDTEPGPGSEGCPFPGAFAPLDSNLVNRCRSWHHDYELPAGACVQGARLTLKWQLTNDRQCQSCPEIPGQPSRLTEALSFGNEALGRSDFGRCFEPFTGAMFGDCPVAAEEGVTTLDLADFPEVLQRLDGTPFTVGLTDDVAVDYATLEIDYTLPSPLNHQYIDHATAPKGLFADHGGELQSLGSCDQPAVAGAGNCGPLCNQQAVPGPALHPILCTDETGGGAALVTDYAVDDFSQLWGFADGSPTQVGECEAFPGTGQTEPDPDECQFCQPVLGDSVATSEPVLCQTDDGAVVVPAGEDLVTTIECDPQDSTAPGSGAPYCPQRSYSLLLDAEVRAVGTNCGSNLGQTCQINYIVEDPPRYLDPFVSWVSPPLAARPVYRNNDLVVQFGTDALCELFSCCGELSPLSLVLADGDGRETGDQVPGQILRQGCNASVDNVASILGQADDFLVFDPDITLEPERRYFLDLPNPDDANEPYLATVFTTSRFTDFKDAMSEARASVSGQRLVVETPEALDWLHTTARFDGQRIDSRRLSEDEDFVHVFVLDQPGDPVPVPGDRLRFHYRSEPHGRCGCFRDGDCSGGGRCTDGVCVGGFSCDLDGDCVNGSCLIEGPVIRRDGGAIDEAVQLILEAGG